MEAAVGFDGTTPSGHAGRLHRVKRVEGQGSGRVSDSWNAAQNTQPAYIVVAQAHERPRTTGPATVVYSGSFCSLVENQSGPEVDGVGIYV